jgi:hypothetical protein
MSSGDAVHLQAAIGLKAPDCLFGAWAEAPIDRTGRIPRPSKKTLQVAHEP